ncbi:hypothetical protein BH18ACT12_BH18ACT12_13380 [soil metagenome]
MSDEKFEQEPKDENEDVEAHSPARGAPVRGNPVRGANDEPGSDDDVEGHTLKARPHRT